MTRAVDQLARDRIREALDCTLIVEAAAGTGKTTALVGRIVAVLENGLAPVEGLVAVTFTEKAAGELKLRVRAEIERARHARAPGDPRRERLEQALSRLEEARVGTIHGFCADILRERSVEAGVDPQFRVLTDPEARRLHAEVFNLWLQRTLDDPPEGVRRSLRRSSREGPVARLRLASWALADWRDFPAPWRRDPFPRAERIDGLVARVHEVADLSAACADPERDPLYRDTAPVRRLSDVTRTAESVAPRDHDGLEAALVDLAADRDFGALKGRGRRYGEGVEREALLVARDGLREASRQFAREADADLAALLQHELLAVTGRYDEAKARAGVLDFVDLLLRTRDLVRDQRDVRADFQRRFRRIFIDEFQDTDPLQAEILLLLGSDDPELADWRRVEPAPGKLFLVGDPKQSIYRFRRADVGTYFEVRDLLGERGAECLRLSTSFRSVPAIQRAVNRAFAGVMDGDRESLQADYVPLSEAREGRDDQPAVVALPVPRPYGRRGVTNTAIEASLPDAVAAFVDWLVKESGWSVTTREHPDRPVAVEARHVCLLFRRFDSYFAGDITRGYVEALEARGIRHLLVGGRSFHAREEVETMRTALVAVEWPDDELSVFATLRGSLFAVGDEELLEFRHRFGRLHPFRIPRCEPPDSLAAIFEALRLLAALHVERNRRAVAETIHLLLEETRAHAAFALRPSGEQALANVLHVADQARAYEGGGGISFRGFVERLIEEADGPGGSSEAPILEDGSDGVRLMTVHKAKGLEFPVVVLADISASLNQRSAGRTIDAERRLCAMRIAGWSPAELLEREPHELRRDAAEGVRLAYVAATRARDLLVVPAVGDGPFERGWIAPLDRAVHPARERRAQAAAGPGCPPFSGPTMLDHPDARMGSFVRAGAHAFADPAPFDVVWWDPATLRLEAPRLQGVRNIDLIGKSVDPAMVEADLARHEGWRREREAALLSGTAPSLRVRTATERALVAGVDVARVRLVELPADPARPAGRRFGALVHAALAVVPLHGDETLVAATVGLEARILGATGPETRAAVETVRAVLAHELLERARRAEDRGECRRETPVALREADGAIVDGVVDLAFREPEGWTILDFKTDRQIERDLEFYRRQVALYALAIAAATGEPATPVLLRV